MTKDITSLDSLSFLVDVHEMTVHFEDGTNRKMPIIDGVENRITECEPQLCLWDVTGTYSNVFVSY